jgi:hypothetical protein
MNKQRTGALSAFATGEDRDVKPRDARLFEGKLLVDLGLEHFKEGKAA